MSRNESLQQEGSCHFGTPLPSVNLHRDCDWRSDNNSYMYNSSNNSHIGTDLAQYSVPHFLSISLSAANTVGIAVAVCVYAALVRKCCYPMYNLMLLLLCALDLLHQATSAAVEWQQWSNDDTGPADLGELRQLIFRNKNVRWFPSEWRMRASLLAAGWLRFLSHAAYPSRNYWVAYICTFRCRLIWRPTVNAAVAADDASIDGIGRQLGLLCARAGAIFLLASCLVGVWHAIANKSEVVFHCSGEHLRLVFSEGITQALLINSTGVYAHISRSDLPCGNDLNAILKVSHLVLFCLLPIVVVILGTYLSLRGLRRSSLAAGRYSRARRLMVLTCGTFVGLEIPYAVTGLMAIAAGRMPPHKYNVAIDTSMVLCSFNSTVILCLNALSNRAIWQQAALAMRRVTRCHRRGGGDNGDLAMALRRPVKSCGSSETPNHGKLLPVASDSTA